MQERDISPIISFSQAKDRLFSAQIDRSTHFALRYRTLCHQQAQFKSPLRGLRGTRASLIPISFILQLKSVIELILACYWRMRLV